MVMELEIINSKKLCYTSYNFYVVTIQFSKERLLFF